MKPLEALKRIRQETCPATILPDFDKEECCKIIEEALKECEQLKAIEEWFNKKKFYGKTLNKPNKILELEFDTLDFRPEEDLLLIHFKVLNSWGTNIFYDILSYGNAWAFTKEELENDY